MIGKILFTAAIIGALLLFARTRTANRPPRRAPAPPPRASATARLAAYGTLALVLITGAVFYYLDWREDHRIINIRVINATSGEAVTYQAYKSAIEGRSFETLDGRRVTLSDAERVEMIELP